MTNPTIESLALQVKELTAKVEALQGNSKPKKKNSEPRKPSKYALFVKENYPRIKEENPSASMGEVSKILAKEWKEK